MDRDAAVNLLTTHVKNKNLVKHCLACEAVLGALASTSARTSRAGASPAYCTISTTTRPADAPDVHGTIAARMLEELAWIPASSTRCSPMPTRFRSNLVSTRRSGWLTHSRAHRRGGADPDGEEARRH